MTDKGVKTWVSRYGTPDGPEPRHTIDEMPSITLKDARDCAAELARMVGNEATQQPTGEGTRLRFWPDADI